MGAGVAAGPTLSTIFLPRSTSRSRPIPIRLDGRARHPLDRSPAARRRPDPTPDRFRLDNSDLDKLKTNIFNKRARNVNLAYIVLILNSSQFSLMSKPPQIFVDTSKVAKIGQKKVTWFEGRQSLEDMEHRFLTCINFSRSFKTDLLS